MTEESPPKPFEQFFAKPMLKLYFHSIWLLAFCMIGLWPDLDMFEFINHQPVNFLLVSIFSLIFVSYVALWIGRGELRIRDPHPYYLPMPNYMLPKNAVREYYGIGKILLHPLLLYLFLIPVLIISATLSATHMLVFLRLFSILVVTAWLCGFVGAFVRITCGFAQALGYFFARALMAVWFIATEFVIPSLNPIHLMSNLFQNQSNAPSSLVLEYYAYLIVCGVIITLLAIANQVKLKQNYSTQAIA